MGRTAMIVCRIYMVYVGLYPLIHFPNFKRMQPGLFTSAMTKAQIDGRRLDDIPDPLHSVALHNYYSDVFAKGFGIEITAGPITSEMKVLPQRRVAPLTGPLVFAETLGVKNKSFNKHSDSTSKLSSHRDQSSSSPNDKSLSFKRKNKYVLESSDDHPAAAKSSLPSPTRTSLRSNNSSPSLCPSSLPISPPAPGIPTISCRRENQPRTSNQAPNYHKCHC